MKKLFVFISILLFFQNINFGQWEVKHLADWGEGGILEKIRFFDDSLGFAVGSDNFLKTTDGGENWVEVDHGIDLWTYDFQFISEDTIYAVGAKPSTQTQMIASEVINSTDGGESWESTVGFSGKQLFSIHFFDSKEGIVSGYDGIYKTNNGGISWDTVFSCRGEGYLYGEIAQIQFLNKNIGFASLLGRNEFGAADGFDFQILKTEDAGVTWQTKADFAQQISEFKFFDDSLGYVEIYGKIFKTEDGGANFDTVYSYSPAAFYDIQFVSKEKVVMVGHSEGWIFEEPLSFSFLKTNDGGETFLEFDTLGIPLRSVYFLNDSVGFVAGWENLIMKTSTCGGKIIGDYPWDRIGDSEEIYNQIQVEVFPNPADDFISIKLIGNQEKDARYQIFSMQGTVLKAGRLEYSETQIDIDNLYSGIYFLKIQTSEGKLGFRKIQIVK